MPGEPNRLTDEQLDFSGGINSDVVTTIASARNPHGLKRNQLAWLDNATVRGGGVTPRNGWQYTCTIGGNTQKWQRGWLYDQDGGNPYLICQMNGQIYQVRLDTDNSIVNLSTQFGLTNPSGVDYAFFTQGEQFLVIQPGDYGTAQVPTLPLFWDGSLLRRSNGAQQNLGTTAANFITPPTQPVPTAVTITLVSPFRGYTNQIFTITVGTSVYTFIQVVPVNFYTLRNDASGNIGALVEAGTPVLHSDGTIVGRVLASFAIPAINSNVGVFIDTAYAGQPLPAPVTINNEAWQIQSTGAAPVGANQIYAVCLSQVNVGGGDTITSPATLYSVQELPAATCMVYYQGRIWYAQGRIYTAGDIVFGTFGTVPYQQTDSILKVTENPLAVGGDGFSVPSNAGTIRALAYTANVDASLGQGPLFIFTRKQIYQLVVPVTRSDWIAATSNNMPLQTVAQITNGSVNDTSVVGVNGDLYFQSLEPGIRSLISAIRYYQQPGQTPISRNESRLIDQNDRSLLRFSSGIEFDNRLLQTALPTLVGQNVVHQALVPLDFDVISSFEEKLPPVWEGSYEGLQFLQVFTGDYGGRQRAFAVIQSEKDQSIQVWEMTDFAQSDTNLLGEARVTWIIETPAYTCDDENQFKELDTVHLWFDSIFGQVIVKVEYREDGNLCWHPWTQFVMCAARNSQEAGTQGYPVIEYCSTDQRPMVLPKAPAYDCNVANNRPVNLGYQFQLRLTIKGFCRLRSIRMFCLPRERNVYQGMIC